MIVYQFNNFIPIIFIVFFSVLLLIGILASILFLPLVRLVFQSGNPVKAKVLISIFVVAVYFMSITLSILSVKNIVEYSSSIRQTDPENCSVVIGEIEELKMIPQYARGANLTSYHLIFKVNNSQYYIDGAVGVPLEDIDLWKNGICVMVYYQNVGEKNLVVLVKTVDSSAP